MALTTKKLPKGVTGATAPLTIDRTTGAIEKKARLSVISRKHPSYLTWIERWKFFLITYFGGEDYAKDNLFKYSKEGEEEFNDRLARASRENHSRRIIDLITSYLFKEAPTRVTESAPLQRFIKNSDGKGNSLNNFMKGISQLSSVLGRIYVVIDRQPIPAAEKTGTAADDLKYTPYCYPIYPQDVLDIEFDKFGNVLWALVRENVRLGAESFYSADVVIRNQFRLWETGRWTLFNESGDEVEKGVTGLKGVPIVAVDNEDIVNVDYAGHSLIADIAYLDRSIFNNWSRLDTIVCDQTFSQLIFPVEGLLAEIAENEELRNQFLALSTKRVMLYSSQASVAPAYISPDAQQAEFILSMIQVQVKQLYSSIGLQAEGNTENSKASGVAKAYDFDKLNRLLADKADNLEQAENRIINVAKEWMNQSAIECEVRYPNEFDTRSLVDDLAIAERMTLLDISDTFQKELNKNLAAKALPKTDEAMLAAIALEIEERVDEKREVADKMEDFSIDAAELSGNFPKAPELQRFGGKDDGNKGASPAGDLNNKITNPRQQHMPLASKSQSRAKAKP